MQREHFKNNISRNILVKILEGEAFNSSSIWAKLSRLYLVLANLVSLEINSIE